MLNLRRCCCCCRTDYANNNESHSSPLLSQAAVEEEKDNGGGDDGAVADQNNSADAETENVKRVVAQHALSVTLHTNTHSFHSLSLFLIYNHRKGQKKRMMILLLPFMRLITPITLAMRTTAKLKKSWHCRQCNRRQLAHAHGNRLPVIISGTVSRARLPTTQMQGHAKCVVRGSEWRMMRLSLTGIIIIVIHTRHHQHRPSQKRKE